MLLPFEFSFLGVSERPLIALIDCLKPIRPKLDCRHSRILRRRQSTLRAYSFQFLFLKMPFII